MMVSDDLIVDILARIRQEVPELTESQALEIETRIRHDWGGERITIAKDIRRRPHVREKIKKRLQEKGLVAVHAEESKKENGVSRRTLYRMLKE